MRIYEFAQSHNISSKDLIEKLQKQGFDVKSHMSVLDDEALSFLNKSLAKVDKNSKNESLTESKTESKSSSPIEKQVPEPSTSSFAKASADKQKPSKISEKATHKTTLRSGFAKASSDRQGERDSKKESTPKEPFVAAPIELV